MSLRYSGVNDVPLALGVFLASDSYDYNSDPNTISATTLIKPLRQIILPSRVPENAGKPLLSDQMRNRMGAAIHDAIERAWLYNHRNAMLSMGFPSNVIDRVLINPEKAQLLPNSIPVYLEQRATKKVGKWTVSGKFDFVGEGRVQDFKSTSVWTYKNQVNNNKYAFQGSIYRWLNPEIITEDDMEIHFIFTDWKANMVKTDPNYPSKHFQTQRFKLLSVPYIEQYITQKLQDIETYWNAAEQDIPYCTDEDLWRSEPVFKYYKSADKTLRSTKNFESKQEAMLRFVQDGSTGLIKEVPGQVTACKYCPAFGVCTQKDLLIERGELIFN